MNHWTVEVNIEEVKPIGMTNKVAYLVLKSSMKECMNEAQRRLGLAQQYGIEANESIVEVTLNAVVREYLEHFWLLAQAHGKQDLLNSEIEDEDEDDYKY